MIDFIVCMIIAFLVKILWLILEIIFHGEIQPGVIEDIITLLLTISLFRNYKQAKEKDENG